MCKQGKGCSRTIFIDSKVSLGWSNGQRQDDFDDFVDKHLQMEEVYVHRCPRF